MSDEYVLRSKQAIAMLLLFAIAACGGGGGGSVGSLPPTSDSTPVQSVALTTVQALPEYRPFRRAPRNGQLHIAPLSFAPGTRDGLVNGPNPRVISNVISGGTDANGDNGGTNDPVLSDWLYLMGQFVDHDLSLEETPPTNPAINIVVPAGDPQFPNGTVIAMTRATRNPSTNTIVNTIDAHLNLSQVYGQSDAVADSLRNADGTLKSSGNGLYLPVVGTAFVTGDPRVMENPELTAITTLFMREHNYWVRTLRAQHPRWSGNDLYRLARAITTAEYHNIIYSAYLPHLIGPVLGPYRGYDPNVDTQVTQEFSTAAFRVGHSQVSDTQVGINAAGAVVFTQSLANAFFNTAAQDESNGIDPLLNSLSRNNAQATDVFAVGVLRNMLVADLVGGDVDRIDLMAIDIQRERDIGLGTLNQTRRALGMRPYASFAALTSDPVLQANFQAVYENIDSVDLFMGGLAEAHAPGAVVGPTFQAIIADQFQRVRSGDRFFWMNQGFDGPTRTMIANTTLATLMQRNTFLTNAHGDLFISSP